MMNDLSARILVAGAAGMLVAAFILAWIVTTARLIPIAAVQRSVKDYGSVVRAHIDLMMMALFCLAFAAQKIALPVAACGLVVIGGFTNPSLFVLRGFVPGVGKTPAMRLYRLTSFTISTLGFMWVAALLLRSVFA